MKTRMYICGLLALAISPICTLLGEETSPGGIVHGPKAGFNITAPEGWVLDTEAGKGQGFPCVLYPKGSSWADAKTGDVRECSRPSMGRRKRIRGNGDQGNEGKAWHPEGEDCFR